MNRKALIFIVALGAAGSVALASLNSVDVSRNDKWSEVNEFKAQLPALLQGSKNDAGKFNLASLGEQLGQMTIDGLNVCAHEEIGAEQYIKLSAIVKAVSEYPGVTLQVRELLDSERPVSDCQFRILEAATGIY
jgi:hypothetical protein